MLFRSADGGDAEVQVAMFHALSGGWKDTEFPRDEAAALSYLRDAAAQHNKEAMRILGMLMIEGQLVTPNEVAGVSYLRAASHLKDREAMLYLARYYYSKKDFANSEAQARAAYEAGEPSAAYVLFLINKHVVKDEELALRYLKEAAEKGVDAALFELGKFYMEEQPDGKRAQEFLLRAAEAGHTDAMLKLAELHSKPEWGLYDAKLAEKWRRKAQKN